jgi:hypothetical protein
MRNPHPLKGRNTAAFILAILLLGTSCRVSKELHKKAVTETVVSNVSSNLIDTSKINTVEVATVSRAFGDTLHGALVFTDEQIAAMESGEPFAEDSIESDGIKVKVTMLPFKYGFKTKITAIAKAKIITDSYTRQTIVQKGVSVVHTENIEKKNVSVTKEKKITSFPWGLLLWFIPVAAVIYLSRKYKNFI